MRMPRNRLCDTKLVDAEKKKTMGRLFWSLIGRLRRPRYLVLVLALGFLGTATFYWQLWEIPFLGITSSESLVEDAWDVTAEQTSDFPFRPMPLNCVSKPIEVVPTDKFCNWDTSLAGCYEMLEPTLNQQPSWVFLGDDGMANIPYYLSTKWPFGNVNITSRRNPCQNLLYYRLPPPDNGWTAPDPLKGEGPVGRGKERPYCMDSNSWNVKLRGDTNVDRYVEFLTVEFARDVSLQTLVTETTQKTIAYYLSREPPAVCIATAGLNDAAIQPPISEDLFIKNMDKYLALLQRTCHNVVWLSLHAIVESPDTPQTNCQLRKWNSAMLSAIASRNYDNVYVINVWDRSFYSDFHSPTRLGRTFYASLARLFRSLLNGPDQ